MNERNAAVGSLAFLIAAPGVVAGLVPWLLTDWEITPMPAWWEPLRVVGLALIVGGLVVLRGRPAGDSVTTAFGQFVVQPRGLLGSGGVGASEAIVASARLIIGSRPLLARERELWDDYTAALAELIATERGASSDDLEPSVIANALIGVQRALVADVRRQLLAGEPIDAVARRVRVRGRRAMSVLQRGLDPTT
jgi:hypothetical protein